MYSVIDCEYQAREKWNGISFLVILVIMNGISATRRFPANRYGKQCAVCQQWTPAGTGVRERHNGEWVITHRTCPKTRRTERCANQLGNELAALLGGPPLRVTQVNEALATAARLHRTGWLEGADRQIRVVSAVLESSAVTGIDRCTLHDLVEHYFGFCL